MSIAVTIPSRFKLGLLPSHPNVMINVILVWVCVVKAEVGDVVGVVDDGSSFSDGDGTGKRPIWIDPRSIVSIVSITASNTCNLISLAR